MEQPYNTESGIGSSGSALAMLTGSSCPGSHHLPCEKLYLEMLGIVCQADALITKPHGPSPFALVGSLNESPFTCKELQMSRVNIYQI